jgi:flagellar biosynthetic protein FliQ
MLIVAVLAGLIISVFQATTQINEPTLAFVPKIVAVLLAILIFAGFMMNMGIEFTQRLFESILSYIG